jgi:malate dehydrogenase (oxaloacetate-decarboxylating)
MFVAAASVLADMVDASTLGAAILPPVSTLREVSRAVAIAVGEQAGRENLVRANISDLPRAIDDATWEARYRTIRAV